MEKNLIAAELMKHLCNCPEHGYSQGTNRWGNSKTCTVYIDGNAYRIRSGDRDCSSAVIDCWETALGEEIEATYTGDMLRGFLQTGFFSWEPMGNGYIAKPGDIYLNHRSHTAMCIDDSPDLLGEFWLNSHGGITGDTEGDQTGGESRIVYYYDFPWDGILRYIGSDDMDPKEFFNYEIPKASGGDMPVWQFFTWVTEHVASIFEYTYSIKNTLEELSKNRNANAAMLSRLEDIEALLINIRCTGSSVTESDVAKIKTLLAEVEKLLKK